MLVKHSGNVIREIDFNESMIKNIDNPKPWQFKSFYDAAIYGVELIWTYPDFDTEAEYYSNLSDSLFAITFDEMVLLSANQNILVFPHHARELNDPFPVLQMIEFDWYPGKLKVIFQKNTGVFVKGKPFAQAIVVPRRGYTLKEMTQEEKEKNIKALEFIESNNFSTRDITVNGFETQNNTYEVLSNLNKKSELPEEIKAPARLSIKR